MMVIVGNLFSKGYLTRQPGLSDALDRHKQGFINRVRAITDLDQMTDLLVHELVAESLISPFTLHLDRMTRQFRTEEFRGDEFPDRFNFNVQPLKRYPKTVARISIPFTGDPDLPQYTPNEGVFNFPRGQVSGNSIQFDVIFWNYHDDNERVAIAGDVPEHWVAMSPSRGMSERIVHHFVNEHTLDQERAKATHEVGVEEQLSAISSQSRHAPVGLHRQSQGEGRKEGRLRIATQDELRASSGESPAGRVLSALPGGGFLQCREGFITNYHESSSEKENRCGFECHRVYPAGLAASWEPLAPSKSVAVAVV